MLSRSSGRVPLGRYAYEPKWDGFRAIVSLNGDLRVRSRRDWNMTKLVPELRAMPATGLFDGELVAFRDGQPWFPDVCRRLLHGASTVPLTFVVFDLLQHDGDDLRNEPYRTRRALLESLDLNGHYWQTTPAFDDGEALWRVVCDQGLEGLVAKRLDERYRPGVRRWVKVKNPNYWRREIELTSLASSFQRRGTGASARSMFGTR
jgi:bifunctional non-homologous end joining protein LigD